MVQADWAETDCDKLPEERQLERKEDAELDLAIGPKKISPAAVLDLNTAARDELMSIPGVGEVIAIRIIEGRPYATIEELDKVEGVGPKMLAKLRIYLRISD